MILVANKSYSFTLTTIFSATGISFVGREVDAAFLVHVRIWLHSVVSWQFHPVVAKELTVGQSGVCCDTSLGSSIGLVEKGKRVDVSGYEFSALDFEVSK